jgi:hypothetical protein
MMTRQRILIFLLLSGTTLVSAQYFPRSGRGAISQESLDLQGRLNVLSISLRPGYEDLATLAFFRMGKGAGITSAYLTNGEAGEDDLRGEYPMHHAGELREEATKALAKIDGGALFLNMPDVPAASAMLAVRMKWRSDTLRARLTRLIVETRPDVILVARDWLGGPASPQMAVLVSELTQVLRSVESIKSTDARQSNPWVVARVLVDKGTKNGVQAPTTGIHPMWKKSYRDIGIEAGEEYHSIAVQRKQWIVDAFGGQAKQGSMRYELLAPMQATRLKQMDENLPAPLTARLKDIGKGIADLSAATMRGQSTLPGAGNKSEKVAVRLTDLMQRLELYISHLYDLTPQERKIVIQWKGSLEDLRNALHGIEVRYTFEPTLLAERQVALLRIDTIIGLKPGGTTFLYFPQLDRLGWVVNEKLQKKVDLTLHEALRILSPGTLPYHLPAGLQGLEQTSTSSAFLIYVIHQGAKPGDDFTYRIAEPVKFAPRFTAEVLTPMVSVVPSEQVVVRLTNHSRDGVRDSIWVDDSLATSEKHEFRLNTKDGVFQDTLTLKWHMSLDEGTYVVPVKIADRVVSSVAARRFDVCLDSSKKVGLLTGIEASPVADVLRRLGARWTMLNSHPQGAVDLSGYHVVVLDRRAMSLATSFDSYREPLVQFVQKGGHLIILAQDAGTWNAHPLVDGLKLTASGVYDEKTAIEADTSSALLTVPNRIVKGEWSNWLFQIAYNTLSGPALEQAVVPVRAAADHNPLVVTWKKGTGTITYTDLAMNPQFFNVHPGVYRLLANLLSY